MSRRRAVITGLGAVSPLGCGVPAIWSRVLAGECGVASFRALLELSPSPLTGDAARLSKLACQVAAAVPRGSGPDEFDAERDVPKALRRRYLLKDPCC